MKKIIAFLLGKYPKKYIAVIQTDYNKVIKVPFGDQRFGQYHDKIGYYSGLDHHDEKRRNKYYQRHNKDYEKFSPDWLSKTYLW
jgi:hypothetical protein